MSTDYVIKKAALHLIDRTKSKALLATHEIDLVADQNQANNTVIGQFLSSHLDHIYNAEENNRTRPAVFDDSSIVKTYYKEIENNIDCFFQCSCDLAQGLYDVSKKKRSSPGVLLVLWFFKTAIDTPFLALLKMDPGPSNTISLDQNSSGELLLDLAIYHSEHSLPGESSSILKWAITPHPNRGNYNVKVKDEQGGVDPSQYFMEFLGCSARLSEKNQTLILLDILPTYAQATHPEQNCTEAVQTVLQELEEVPSITPEVIFDTVKKKDVLPNFQLESFKEELARKNSEDLNITTAVFNNTRLQYSLPSGIVIKGPRTIMEDLVKENTLEDGSKELRIRTPSFEKKYV